MYERIFLDTNPIIYLMNAVQPYSGKVSEFLSHCRDAEFYTSTITDAEFLVHPYRQRDFATTAKYGLFLSRLNVLKCFVTDAIAERAAKIRAEYPAIKLGDSI